MKHLKIRGELSKDHTHVMVQIVEQTHRCAEFGKILGFSSFSCGNGVELYSISNPAHDTSVSHVASNSVVYVRGYFEHLDHTPIKIPIDLWPKLKAAVNAYNEWGANQ